MPGLNQSADQSQRLTPSISWELQKMLQANKTLFLELANEYIKQGSPLGDYTNMYMQPTTENVESLKTAFEREYKEKVRKKSLGSNIWFMGPLLFHSLWAVYNSVICRQLTAMQIILVQRCTSESFSDGGSIDFSSPMWNKPVLHFWSKFIEVFLMWPMYVFTLWILFEAGCSIFLVPSLISELKSLMCFYFIRV